MSAEPTQTISSYLRPIDRDGLLAFASKGRENPDARGTNKVHTVTDGQYRTVSHVNEHEVVVDEPLHLFGQDTAPAPGGFYRGFNAFHQFVTGVNIDARIAIAQGCLGRSVGFHGLLVQEIIVVCYFTRLAGKSPSMKIGKQ